MKNLFYIFMLMVTILTVASCKQESKSQQGQETKSARQVDCDEFEKSLPTKIQSFSWTCALQTSSTKDI